jgi:tetratricopeptide (TPR) repeat protein
MVLLLHTRPLGGIRLALAEIEAPGSIDSEPVDLRTGIPGRDRRPNLLVFPAGMFLLLEMTARHGFLLAVALQAAPADAQDVTTDDLWKMLQKSSSEASAADKAAEDPESPLARGLRRQKILQEARNQISPYLLPSLAPAKAANETWPDANLKYRFDDGWSKASDDMWRGVMKTYYNSKRELSLALTVNALTKGEPGTAEELLRKFDASTSESLKDARKVEATGLAKELGMTVTEAELNGSELKGKAMIGRMVRNGAIYGLTVFGKDLESVRREFARFLTTLEWIEPAKDMHVPPLAELKVAGSGFVLPCDGALVAAAPPEIPFGSAASRLSRRVELTAFDVRGMELPVRDLATGFLESMAIAQGGNHVIEESRWGEMPALRVRPKTKARILGRTVDWRLHCTLSHGFLCIALGYWPDGTDEAEAQHDALIARATFSQPSGEIQKLTKEEDLAYAAFVYNQIGLKAFDKGQFNHAAKAFGVSVSLSDKDPVAVINLANALTEQGRVKGALEVITTASRKFPEHQAIKQWHAGLLARSGKAAEASVVYEDLFKGGLRDKAELSLWIQALQTLGKHDRAAEIAKTVFEEGGELAWRRIHANCLWTGGKLDEARAAFEELATELDEDAGFVADHASLLLDAGDFNAVLKTVGKWEQSGEAPAALLFSKGMAQSGLGWFKDAVATFTKLDEMVPGNQTVKEALAHAQAMLGRGTQEGLRDDLAAVPIPPDLASRAAEAVAGSKFDEEFRGEGSVTLEDLRVWHWTEGSDARMTHRRRIKVLGASGVSAYSTLFVPFKPLTDRVNIHEMNVTDKDGGKIATYRKEEMYIRDGNGEIADGGKIVCIPVPALVEGAVIEFVYTKSLLGTADRFPMVVGGVPEEAALVYGAVAFTGDLGKIRFANTGRLARASGGSWTSFEATMVRRRQGLSHLPPYDQWGMMCWACDERLTWEDEVKTYLGEISDRLAETGFADKVAGELQLAGKPPAEVVRTVVRWLNAKFQYQGLEFGRRARIPAKASTTLERGFGDCKDLSLLVRAVLREAGIRAELALVNSSGVVRQDMPSLDQFDHMVLHLPELGGTILDATMRHFNTPEALAVSSIGSSALVIEGESPRFVGMKEASGIERSLTIGRDLRIDAVTGDVAVIERVSLSAAQASILRYALSATAEAEHLKIIESMMRRIVARLELRKFEVSHLDGPFEPLEMAIEYVLPAAFENEGGVLSGSIPSVFEKWMFEMDRERDRNIGVLIRSTERCTVSNRIHTPAGFEWIQPATLEQKAGESGGFDGSLTWTAQPDGILMSGTMQLSPCEGGVELHQRIQKASDHMFSQLAERIKFRAQ